MRQSRETRRARGAFFTPEPLVSFVVEEALERRFAAGDVEWHEDGYPLLRVLDPAAGDGRFLIAAAGALVRKGRALGHPVSEDAIRKHCLVAIEREAEYAAHVRQALGAEAEVHCDEALLSGCIANRSVDVVVGNPPYLRSITLGQVDDSLRTRLRGRFASTSHGEWDLYAAFIEMGIEWLRTGGVMGLVVPSRWWTAKWAGPLRALLGSKRALASLVDFGDAQIFSGATVYASLCFASDEAAAEIEMARLEGGTWRIGTIDSATLMGSKPWDLAIGANRGIVDALRTHPRTLGEIARIAKGTGTNADSVFLIDSENRGVEPELLRSVVRGRDVAPLGVVPVWPKLLVPYDEAGMLLAPSEMQARYPGAMEHLRRHRARLESREGGRFAGDSFYCFGRPQNLKYLQNAAPKVVVPDVTRAGRALVDASAAMVLDSAYAIRLHEPADLSHETLCGILCSRVVKLWLDSQGVPLRGGYTRMKTAYLRSLPVPAAGSEMRRIGELVGARAGLEAIDAQVLRAYGLAAAS